MTVSRTALSLLLLGLFQISVLASSKGVSSFIYSPHRTLPSNILKELPDSTVYSDKDLQNLILHNLNLLSLDQTLGANAEKIIQEYGNKNLVKPQKLNFAFLVEGNTPASLVQKSSNPANKHRQALFNVCNGKKSSHCILNHLFDINNENSVVGTLKKQTGLENPEAYFYSSNSKVGENFGRSTLRSGSDRNGGIYIIDDTTSSQYKIAENLNSCVNKILKGELTVDAEAGTIHANESPVLSCNEDNKAHVLNYLNDICSIVGVSTLIKKDPNPSFFTFHINSLKNAEKNVDNAAVLYQIFNIAYEKFLENLQARYGTEELAGQVIALSPENNINTGDEAEVAFIELSDGLKMINSRILVEQTDVVYGTDSTTNIIFGGTLIVFMIVTAWVCIELFNMDIQKDSVVYAKFLAVDYFKK